MIALIIIVACFNVPNPNMILISGLVINSALFGYNGGIPSGALMPLYSMYFFSDGNNFVRYGSVGLQKLAVAFIDIMVVIIFACELKKNSMRAFEEVEKLTERLQEDNVVLRELSLYDPLTGVRNRLALRRDFNDYIGQNVTVVMIDLDNFKGINDTYGHEQGDHVLSSH